jgi:hypothetical protein
MLDYIAILAIIGVVAIAEAVHYMHKAGYDDHGFHKGAH